MSPRLLVLLVAQFLCFVGCASSRKDEIRVPNPRELAGENREWWDIYSVEFREDRKLRARVGYLYRKYDDKDPKGKYWVRNLAQHDVGFILPENQAFLIAPATEPNSEPKAQPIGTTDLYGGIKKILQVPGTVELDKVALSSATGGRG